MSSHSFRESLKTLLAFSCAIFLTVSVLPARGFGVAPDTGSYNYKFSVNQDGFTMTTVDFSSSGAKGSSWSFVPSSGNWTRKLLSGSLLQNELVNISEVTSLENTFYEAFKFSFKSDGSFKITFKFNLTIGAIIVEPRGMFFSPFVGFQDDSSGNAEVFLPKNSRLVEAVALGNSTQYGPTKTTLDYALFDLRENVLRLQIEFKTGISNPDLSTVRRDIFNFETVKRYESYASSILDLFSTAYDRYVDFFNVTLESVNIKFFVPEFNTVLSMGGYVPFSGGEVGDIHMNLFFARSIKGVLEIIALHELVHHFLLKAGLSPNDLLWFHEGMAQYVSIETADTLSYTEGASSERGKLENDIPNILRQTSGDIHFIQGWKPETQPVNISDYYMTSYYVVSTLAENYGGLDYYGLFFKLLKGEEINNDDILAYYLSLAAKTSVVPSLRSLGLIIADLYDSSAPVIEAEKAVHNLNPLLQPYRLIAEYLYRQALVSLEKGDLEKANQYLVTSIFIARYAPMLTLATLAVILAAFMYAFRRYGTSPNVKRPIQY